VSDPVVRLEVSGAFATLVLDSPGTNNAISSRTVTEFLTGLETARSDPKVRAAIITHTGKSFCAGADMRDVTPASAREHSRVYADMLRALIALPKPVIAKVDGHVRGAGMGLVAACDLAVAGRNSSFALGEVRLGIAPHLVSLAVLPKINTRAVGRYFLTGERFDAATAESIGLVTLAADDVVGATADLCSALMLGSPLGLAEAKYLLNRVVLEDFDRTVDELIDRVIVCSESDDAAEGMAAFFEKRRPRWASDLS
jgi:enoyl-CoA hydratase